MIKMRRNGTIALLAFSVIIFAFARIGYSTEPNGFRNIFFGTHIKELPHLKLIKIGEIGEEKRYIIKDDPLRIGSVELEKIWYIFYGERFASAYVGFRSVINFNRIKKIFFDAYGKGLRVKGHTLEIISWKGDRVDIFLTFNEQDGQGDALYSYKPIMDKNKGILQRGEEEKNVSSSDFPPPVRSFRKNNIEDEIDRNIEEKKAIEKRTDIDEVEKMNLKVKVDIEYEKRVKRIRDRKLMKEELEALKEKCQKRLDELRRQQSRSWPGLSDAYRENEKLKRDCEAEEKQIRDYYKMDD
jgi:hypothetical protein